MKVLVVGSGGREHAIGWQCDGFKEVPHVFYAPGNACKVVVKKRSKLEI